MGQAFGRPHPAVAVTGIGHGEEGGSGAWSDSAHRSVPGVGCAAAHRHRDTGGRRTGVRTAVAGERLVVGAQCRGIGGVDDSGLGGICGGALAQRWFHPEQVAAGVKPRPQTRPGSPALGDPRPPEGPMSLSGGGGHHAGGDPPEGAHHVVPGIPRVPGAPLPRRQGRSERGFPTGRHPAGCLLTRRLYPLPRHQPVNRRRVSALYKVGDAERLVGSLPAGVHRLRPCPSRIEAHDHEVLSDTVRQWTRASVLPRSVVAGDGVSSSHAPP
ncbi:hypothetical protein SGRIM128S_02106 [Streptomyces griseomycini]